MAATKTRMPGLKGGALRDFSGGPNLRDTPPELKANEVEDSWNITYDERGGADSRLGYAKQNATPFTGGVVVAMFWSGILDDRITQAGTELYLGDTNTSRHTFTTADPVGFAEMNDLLIVAHPVDGLFTSPDALTWTAVADANAPANPACIMVWQTKLWAGAADGTVYWSAIGDPTVWDPAATPDPGGFIRLWEHDQQGIVALHVSSGQDIQGRPGLLAFKQDSFYRINDSTTGSYTTMSTTVGAASKQAVVGVGSRVCWIGKHGVFWWRDGLAEPVDASDRLAPLWQQGQVNLGQLALWAAGRKQNRAVFSLTRAGSSANDLALELHPEQQWLAPHSNAMSCYATSSGAAETLYGGSPTVSGQVYELEQGGTDDGAVIGWRLQTRWVELNGGFQAYVWQIRVHGRGAGVMTARVDYEDSGGKDYTLTLTGGDAVMYDSGLDYDAGYQYVATAFQHSQPVFSIGRARQISLLFAGSASTTVAAPQVLGAGSSPQVGEFGLTGIEWLYVELGLS